jgi:pimeloyl-ACP methyl ester carboxylesterase
METRRTDTAALRLFLSMVLALCLAVLPSAVLAAPAAATARTIPLGMASAGGQTTAEQQDLVQRYNQAYWVYLAVLACAGTYDPAGSETWKYLERYGWHLEASQKETQKALANYSLARVTVPDGQHIYVVAFRGSADKRDWKSDLTVRRVPFDRKTAARGGPYETSVPQVHQGFSDYTDAALQAQEVQSLLQAFRADPEAHLLLTGHSLGGAAATLFGLRLIDAGLPSSRIHTITFGAPAVGNKAFADTYGSRLDLVRVVNTADPIPGSLQTFFGGYQQFGTVQTFNIPKTVAAFTHGMNLYLDAAWKHYSDAASQAVQAGLVQELPARREGTSYPLTALVLRQEKGQDAMPFFPYLRTFVEREYKNSLPRYVVVESRDVTSAGTIPADADYVLSVTARAAAERQSGRWYLVLEQGLFDAHTGRLLGMTSTSRRTGSEDGNIETAMAALRVQQQELQRLLPWYPR